MKLSDKVLIKVYAGVLGAVTTVVTQKAISGAWKLATGQQPPKPTDPNVPAGEAFAWALASALGLGAAQLAVSRFSAKLTIAKGGAPKLKQTNFKV